MRIKTEGIDVTDKGTIDRGFIGQWMRYKSTLFPPMEPIYKVHECDGREYLVSGYVWREEND